MERSGIASGTPTENVPWARSERTAAWLQRRAAICLSVCQPEVETVAQSPISFQVTARRPSGQAGLGRGGPLPWGAGLAKLGRVGDPSVGRQIDGVLARVAPHRELRPWKTAVRASRKMLPAGRRHHRLKRASRQPPPSYCPMPRVRQRWVLGLTTQPTIGPVRRRAGSQLGQTQPSRRIGPRPLPVAMPRRGLPRCPATGLRRACNAGRRSVGGNWRQWFC